MRDTGDPARVNIALVGAGTIAASYVEGLQASPGFEVTLVCSSSGASARALAAEHGLRASSLDTILRDPEVDYVLNLTPADEHVPLTRACLEAGKSVYSEKPLAGSLEEADALIALAEQRRLLLACAPATLLWPPLATAREMVVQDRLGAIVGACTTLVYPGPQLFHPAPGRLFGALAGPLRDMGVYQVTALLALLGPVKLVSAFASRARDERTVMVGPDAGATFPVVAQTHVHAQLIHTTGAISSLMVSFDGYCARAPVLEVWGQRAGISLENWYAPDAKLSFSDQLGQRTEIALNGPAWSPQSLAIGPTSAWAEHHEGKEVTISARRARDALAVMVAMETSSQSNRTIELASRAP